MKRHVLFTLVSLVALTFSSCNRDSWSVDLTAQYDKVFNEVRSNIFHIGLAGTGTITIDWGDGSVLTDVPLQPEIKHESDEEDLEDQYEGKKFTHLYDKVGTYQVRITGKDGALTLLDCTPRYEPSGDYNNVYSSLQLKSCSPLKWLYCPYNRLISLDVSQCMQLKELNCHKNQLASLDVSQCTQLKELYCSRNRLTSLNVSKCTKLKVLDCYWNRFISLDINDCAQLKRLDCRSDQLNSLDISKCTQLKELYCKDNQLTSLEVSACTQLEYLECGNNQLTSLNVSECTLLKRLECSGNRLSASAMNRIYNALPTWSADTYAHIFVDGATAGDYYIAKNKGWEVGFW